MEQKYLNASFKGKDLLEATGNNLKASLQFKDLMQMLSDCTKSTSTEHQKKEIYDFAYFIYGDKKRAELFTDKILEVLTK
jgi:hypothetical protein